MIVRWFHPHASPPHCYDSSIAMSSQPRSTPSLHFQRENTCESASASPDLVKSLVDSIAGESGIRHLGSEQLPSRDAVAEMIELIRTLMFPGFFGSPDVSRDNITHHVQITLGRVIEIAREQFSRALQYQRADPTSPRLERSAIDPDHAATRADELAQRFVETFPELRRLLALDVDAAYEGDPSATHIDETIFCYPGVDAIFAHRISHQLHALDVPMIPRMIHEQAHSRTGIDIHPAARIGESFFIDHGGGVVIGETTEIGKNVRIYQGVTLGNKSFEVDDAGHMIRGTKRHPTLGDRVIIYAGACVLGGDTTVGDDCIISGSVYVTESVPPGHIVRQEKPELVMRTNTRRMAVPGQPISTSNPDDE